MVLLVVSKQNIHSTYLYTYIRIYYNGEHLVTLILVTFSHGGAGAQIVTVLPKYFNLVTNGCK